MKLVKSRRAGSLHKNDTPRGTAETKDVEACSQCHVKYGLAACFFSASQGYKVCFFVEKENPAFDAGFRERYAFDQKSSNR